MRCSGLSRRPSASAATSARSFNPPEILHGPSHAKGRHRRPFRPPLRCANPPASPRNRGGPEGTAHVSAVRRDLGPSEIDRRLGVPPVRLRLRRRGPPPPRDDPLYTRGHRGGGGARNERGGGAAGTKAGKAREPSRRAS